MNRICREGQDDVEFNLNSIFGDTFANILIPKVSRPLVSRFSNFDENFKIQFSDFRTS